ncbi:hypothetical protein C4J81_17195 [Deltaproteobacteria bacterium Smac51]|nr:hypothetical protein C4J81_17195 [Deltaproteobacteria bacterium Smac51]
MNDKKATESIVNETDNLTFKSFNMLYEFSKLTTDNSPATLTHQEHMDGINRLLADSEKESQDD